MVGKGRRGVLTECERVPLHTGRHPIHTVSHIVRRTPNLVQGVGPVPGDLLGGLNRPGEQGVVRRAVLHRLRILAHRIHETIHVDLQVLCRLCRLL